jgi:serine/threonine protein kinase
MDPRIGRQVGNYTIEKQIGKGQFGTVYLAKNVQTGLPFAVKCIARAVSQVSLTTGHRKEL